MTDPCVWPKDSIRVDPGSWLDIALAGRFGSAAWLEGLSLRRYRIGCSAILLSIIMSAPALGMAGVNDDNDCIRLGAVTIADNPVLDAIVGRELTAPFIGACIDARLIRELVDSISGWFIDEGLVTTRPYLLEQDISDGEIEIEVLVGRVEAVVDASTGAGNASISSAFLFNGSLLNLRKLETALEAIERPQSVQASFEIGPGTEPGGSIVAISTTRTSPWSGQLGANARTDVDPQLSFRVALDNPFNINDTIEFRYNSGDVFQAYQSDRSRELEYSVQIGASLLSLIHSDLRYKQRLQGIGGSFLAEGDSVTDELRISHLFGRGQTYRFRLGFGFELEDNSNSFEGEKIDVSSYKTTKAEINLQHEWFAGWGQLLSRYAYQQGLDSYGARDDDYFVAADGNGSEARLQFEKHVLATQAYVTLPDPAWYIGIALHLQYSDDILYDRDRLLLGSESTVRGYTSALSGSKGWYARSELVRRWQANDTSFDVKALRKSIALSIGFDYGEIDCQFDNRDVCGEIYSVAAGLTIADDNFTGLLSWGHPLRELDDAGEEDVFLLDLRWGL